MYDSETSQKAVYEDSVKPVVTQVVQGRNASVFAYGPTGAGEWIHWELVCDSPRCKLTSGPRV